MLSATVAHTATTYPKGIQPPNPVEPTQNVHKKKAISGGASSMNNGNLIKHNRGISNYSPKRFLIAQKDS